MIRTLVRAVPAVLIATLGACGGDGDDSALAAAPPAPSPSPSPSPGATAPAITSQPSSQSVATGAAATFSVVATGTAPLSYQWQIGGAAITGATAASYTTPAATMKLRTPLARSRWW